MSNALKQWWKSVGKSEKNGIVVLGAFFIGVFLLTSGIWIGQAIGKIVS
ncbi:MULTISPECIES: hypothetical protein [Microbulbifer]|nr:MULTISPECIES: hypothetical protein [Microbulbifer]